MQAAHKSNTPRPDPAFNPAFKFRPDLPYDLYRGTKPPGSKHLNYHTQKTTNGSLFANPGVKAIAGVMIVIGAGTSWLGGFGLAIAAVGIALLFTSTLASASERPKGQDLVAHLAESLGWAIFGIPLVTIGTIIELCTNCSSDSGDDAGDGDGRAARSRVAQRNSANKTRNASDHPRPLPGGHVGLPPAPGFNSDVPASTTIPETSPLLNAQRFPVKNAGQDQLAKPSETPGTGSATSTSPSGTSLPPPPPVIAPIDTNSSSPQEAGAASPLIITITSHDADKR